MKSKSIKNLSNVVNLQNGRYVYKDTTIDVGANSHNESIYSFFIRIQPKGFWADVINIHGRNDTQEGPFKIEIHWSSGGSDGSISSIETAKRFQNGLELAIELESSIRTIFNKEIK